MKLLLFTLLGFFSLTLNAQKYSGQWSGSFDAKGQDGATEYVLEIEATGNSFTGTSITYFIYSGKKYYTVCEIKGTIDKASKTLTSTEIIVIKKNTPADQKDCLQTHILTYFRKGETEELAGVWKGARVEDKCGTGSTTLSRKQMVKNLITTPPPPANNVRMNTTIKKPAVPVTKKPVTSNTSVTKPAVTKPLTIKTIPKKDSVIKSKPAITKVDNTNKPQNNPTTKPVIAAPKLPNGLQQRENKVFETIAIEEVEITVNIFDNAEVDGDIITVLFNGEVVAYQKTLSEKPVTLKLKAIKGRDNTLTMYAENQGTVPPNTAIMRVQCGDDYYKVFLSADDKKNGSVVFRVK